nr:unnamed protein product [Digitaria exilis]
MEQSETTTVMGLRGSCLNSQQHHFCYVTVMRVVEWLILGPALDGFAAGTPEMHRPDVEGVLNNMAEAGRPEPLREAGSSVVVRSTVNSTTLDESKFTVVFCFKVSWDYNHWDDCYCCGDKHWDESNCQPSMEECRANCPGCNPKCSP